MNVFVEPESKRAYTSHLSSTITGTMGKYTPEHTVFKFTFPLEIISPLASEPLVSSET
jgi:hypothetical protein